MDTRNIWTNGLGEARSLVERLMQDREFVNGCIRFSDLLTNTFSAGGSVFSCGNGGSHCDAMHFAEELTGRYRKNRRPLGALALGDPSHVTCVGNDYGFASVFARQLQGLARPGDLLLLLSTSGNSPNLLQAAEAARELKLPTVALLGRDGGKLRTLVDHAIVVPAVTSDRIQEVHIKIIHIAIEAVERALFPENYETSSAQD